AYFATEMTSPSTETALRTPRIGRCGARMRGLQDQLVRRLGRFVQLSRMPSQSLDFRVEELLRTRRAHVGLGDKGCPGIDIGRHLLALRGGERSLDAVITHTEWVLHDEPGEHVVLQEFDELLVRPH